ncbi:MAG: hypothetical protein WBY94_29235 [Polyangiaceae bacterium]
MVLELSRVSCVFGYGLLVASLACNSTPTRSQSLATSPVVGAGASDSGTSNVGASDSGASNAFAPEAGASNASSAGVGQGEAADAAAGIGPSANAGSADASLALDGSSGSEPISVDAGGDSQTATKASDGGGCTSAIVCDDFEKDTVGAAPGAPWQVATTAGTVTVDSTRAASGTKSIKVVAPIATGYRSAMLRLAGAGLPTPTNVVYGRMMFWLDSAPSASVHWTFIDGSGLVAGANYHSVYRYGGQLPIPSDGGTGSQLMASYDTVDSYSGVGPSSDCWRHSHARAVPVGEWTCAEWEFDGPNNTLRFWLNGDPAPDLTVAGMGDGCISQPATYIWTAPSFSQVDVGWESYQADAARTIWLDDVAIGSTRIGCP